MFNLLIDYSKKIKQLLGDQLYRFPLYILLSLILAILEIFSLGLLPALISSINNPAYLGSFFENNYFLRDISLFHQILLLSLVFIVLYIVKSFLDLFLNKLILKFSYNFGITIRDKMLKSFFAMDFQEISNKNLSSFIYNIVTASSIFSLSVVKSLLDLATNSLIFISIILFLSYKFGLFFLIFSTLLALLIFTYTFFSRRSMFIHGRNIDESSKGIVKAVTESVHGFKDVTVFNLQSYFMSKICSLGRQILDSSVSLFLTKAVSRVIIEVTVLLSIFFFLLYALYQNQELSLIVSSLVIFAAAGFRLLPISNKIQLSILNLSHNFNITNIIYNSLLNYGKDIDFTPLSLGVPFNNVVIKNLTFNYDGNPKVILNDINLDFQIGDVIGIIGRSGGGKSTLLNILSGFLKPTSGSVIVNDDRSISPFEFLASNTAYLPQDAFIFDNTIESNISLGAIESSVDQKKIIKSLQQSHLYNFVDSLPQKLKSLVGDRGCMISGGQRQRLALARALYHDRKILIMDEPTSALDVDTESVILAEINSLKKNKAIILVTHNKSLLDCCSKIYSLEDGSLKLT